MPEFGKTFYWSGKSGNLEAVELMEAFKVRNLKGWEDGSCQRKETWRKTLVGGQG